MGLKTKAQMAADLQGHRKQTGHGANQGTMASETFKKACEAAGVEPTKRQASKWNKGLGSAYAFKNRV